MFPIRDHNPSQRAPVVTFALIAIIGPRWSELLAEHGKSGERDYVREEIAAALKRDIVVIPCLVGREDRMPTLPRRNDLPEEIRDLVLYQKQSVMHESFGRDSEELAAAIHTVLRSKRAPRNWRKIGIAAAHPHLGSRAHGAGTGPDPGAGA